MVLKLFVRFLIKELRKLQIWASEEEKPIYKIDSELQRELSSISTIWDFLEFADNTQAFHLINVLGFDEWIDMWEIRRRIEEIFGIKYKNERSLYPYIKTLVDLGLVEASNIGGKRKWRKKEALIELKKKKKLEAEHITAR